MTGGWAWLLSCSAQLRCGAQPGTTVVCIKKTKPPKDDGGQEKHLRAPVLRCVLRVLVLHVPPKGSVGGGMRVLGVVSAAGR